MDTIGVARTPSGITGTWPGEERLVRARFGREGRDGSTTSTSSDEVGEGAVGGIDVPRTKL